MALKRFLIYLLPLFLFYKCERIEEINTSDKILSLEESIPLIEACKGVSFDDSTKIVTNLIGEWKLIGYGCGFCGPHEPPTATLLLEENTGKLNIKRDGEDATSVEFRWFLGATELGFGEGGNYVIKTESPHYALYMDVFCEKYMYFNHTPWDGSLFLYEKQ